MVKLETISLATVRILHLVFFFSPRFANLQISPVRASFLKFTLLVVLLMRLAMNRKWLVLLVVGALGGCQTVDSESAHIDRETAKNASEIEFERASADQHFNKNHRAPKVVWVQPKNHQEQCLIPIVESEDDPQAKTIIWDGHCREGKADGIGRYLSYEDNQLSSDAVLNFQTTPKSSIRMDFWAFEPSQRRVHIGLIKFDGKAEYTIKMFFYRFIPNAFETHDVYAATEVSDHTKKWIRNVFMASNNPHVVTYFKHESGVVDSMSVIPNAFNKVSLGVDMYNRNTSKKLGVTFYHVNGADWTKNYSFKHSTKQFAELPEGYWDAFIKRFDGMKEESEEVIRITTPIGQKAYEFTKNYCQSSKVIPDGVDRKDYWNLCRVNSALFNVGFKQLWLQNPDKYPILLPEQVKEHK